MVRLLRTLLGGAVLALAACSSDTAVVGPLGLDAGLDAALVCPAGRTACEGRCVDLRTSRDHCGRCGSACEGARVCVDGACALACPEGQRVCGSACATLETDNANCGACGNACSRGQVCAMGRCALECGPSLARCGGDDGGAVAPFCTNPRLDPTNCGTCGNACAAGQSCVNGSCVVACPPGQSVCGGRCVSLESDRMNCGACGNACAAGQVCVGGTCGLECAAGLMRCVRGPNTLCIDAQRDPLNCGACGTACATGERCNLGRCELACPGTQVACNGLCVSLATDRAHCGACGNACPAGQVCSAGACTLECAAGLAACGGGSTARYCADTRNDRNNCGVCGNVCAAGRICVAGTCELSCGAGQTVCAGVCRDLASDNANCGACGVACAAGSVCSNGSCAASCAAPLVACNARCTDPRADVANCGACGMACPGGPGGTAVCAGARCGLSCSAGLADCDGDVANGCEARLDTTTACGACGVRCDFANASAACTAGRCTLGACTGAFRDCNTRAIDGCETNTLNDNANCGACGTTCPAGQVCTAGSCAPACAPGQVVCGGRCTDTSFDPRNCGACGTDCGGRVCARSTCINALSFVSCRDILQRGASTGDGEYEIDPDGPGGAAAFRVFCDMTTSGGGWTRCLRAQNTPAEDITGTTWFDACVNLSNVTGTASQVLVRLRDLANTEVYASVGNRVGTWTFDAITSTAGPSRQYEVTTHDRLVTLANGDRVMVTARNSNDSGCLGSMGNGYGIVLYAPGPLSPTRPRGWLMPFRQANGALRTFWLGNAGWNASQEIVYVPGSYDSCGSVQTGFSGTLEFFVR